MLDIIQMRVLNICGQGPKSALAPFIRGILEVAGKPNEKLTGWCGAVAEHRSEKSARFYSEELVSHLD